MCCYLWSLFWEQNEKEHSSKTNAKRFIDWCLKDMRRWKMACVDSLLFLFEMSDCITEHSWDIHLRKFSTFRCDVVFRDQFPLIYLFALTFHLLLIIVFDRCRRLLHEISVINRTVRFNTFSCDICVASIQLWFVIIDTHPFVDHECSFLVWVKTSPGDCIVSGEMRTFCRIDGVSCRTSHYSFSWKEKSKQSTSMNELTFFLSMMADRMNDS